MIHKISSSLPTFKSIAFSPTLNILLADKALDSSTGRTRNGAGKTSLVEVVHFIFGSYVSATSLFRTPTLNNSSFALSFDTSFGKLEAERTGNDQANVYITPTNLPLPAALITTKSNTRPHFNQKTWRLLLGAVFFGLPSIEDDEVGAPSFRSLFGYFVRRQNTGGINEPHRMDASQQIDNIQVNLSFLFDLDYRLPISLQRVRERERQLRELKSATKSGALGEVIASVAQLRPKLAIADANVRKLAERLQSFKVLDAYNDLGREVATIQRQLREISQSNLLDEQRLTDLREALDSEQDIDEARIDEMFSELQSIMPDAVQRRLDSVRAFHRSVASNRRQQLAGEYENIEKAIATRNVDGELLDRRRAEIIERMNDAGDLADYTTLQRELVREEAELARLRQQFQTAQMLEGGSTTLEIERKDIERRIREDHTARSQRLQDAALIVQELVRSLYDDRSGNLIIDVTPNGPLFKIQIEGDRSEGISKMEIWTFDLLLMRLCADRGIGPRFLIHDSHIFDGVDERQVSSALTVGREYAAKYGFQYIVTLNSDVFDRLNVDEGIKDAVLDVRLRDDRTDGGLFGVIIEERDSRGIAEVTSDEGAEESDPGLFARLFSEVPHRPLMLV